MKSSYIVVCKLCGNENEVKVKDQDMIDFKGGKHAQYAFPYLSPDDRELLISQICPTCFDKMFGGDE